MDKQIIKTIIGAKQQEINNVKLLQRKEVLRSTRASSSRGTQSEKSSSMASSFRSFPSGNGCWRETPYPFIFLKRHHYGLTTATYLRYRCVYK